MEETIHVADARTFETKSGKLQPFKEHLAEDIRDGDAEE